MPRAAPIRRHARSERGFTLIELTVVIAIIAVIASMAFPNVRGLIFEGRSTGKSADLREMTTAAARHLQEFRQPPTESGAWPTLKAGDADGDGTVRIALNTANADASGTMPANIDVTCTTASTSLADAVASCLLTIDFAKVDAYVQNFPKHAGEDVTEDDGSPATYDNDRSTADVVATGVNVGGQTLEIYVLDDGGPSGTPFPPDAIKVWSITDGGAIWAIKSDGIYGR